MIIKKKETGVLFPKTQALPKKSAETKEKIQDRKRGG